MINTAVRQYSALLCLLLEMGDIIKILSAYFTKK